MSDHAAEHDNANMARLRAALERELGSDEVVQWHGWQLGRIEPRMFGIYVFAVPWTLFSLAWTGIATTAVAASEQTGLGLFAWAFPLFGLPFVAVGGWMLSRPFVPLWERGRVLYVVTDKRVLKLSLGRALTIKTVPADRIGLAERREEARGTGTLDLAVRIGRDSDGDRQTESFKIGPVSDIAGAAAAIGGIAANARLRGSGAGALSS
ncbi:MAG: hypothetical protein ACKO01_07195 [Erythrobacter sp.]